MTDEIKGWRVTIECDNARSISEGHGVGERDIDRLMQVIRAAVLGLGYHHDSVDDWIESL